MKTAGNKAFTMVELLMVVMIIGILVTLVVPAVTRALVLVRQSACRSGVRGIIQGLKGYSNVGEEMPAVPLGGKSWNVSIGTNWDKRPFRIPSDTEEPEASERNHSSNLWLLVREEHASLAGFICPGTTDVPSESQDIKMSWDFVSGRNISYGLQSPYGFGGSLSILTPSGVVLVADSSPYVEPATDANRGGKIKSGGLHLVDWGTDDSGEGGGAISNNMLFGNSPNHDREGQNVGYIDGRVEWQSGANCGKNGDNIYTATNKDASKEETSTSAKGVLASGVRNNENDTLILP